MRFDAALVTVPFYTYVIVLGFLITIAYFTAYRPVFPILVFVSLYAGFVGLLLYSILALSEPFEGDIEADNETFLRIADVLESKVTP